MGLMAPQWGHFPADRNDYRVEKMSPDFSSLTSSEAFDALEQAARCRRLAHSVTDQRTLETLREMASEYEDRARGKDPA